MIWTEHLRNPSIRFNRGIERLCRRHHRPRCSCLSPPLPYHAAVAETLRTDDEGTAVAPKNDDYYCSSAMETVVVDARITDDADANDDAGAIAAEMNSDEWSSTLAAIPSDSNHIHSYQYCRHYPNEIMYRFAAVIPASYRRPRSLGNSRPTAVDRTYCSPTRNAVDSPCQGQGDWCVSPSVFDCRTKLSPPPFPYTMSRPGRWSLHLLA